MLIWILMLLLAGPGLADDAALKPPTPPSQPESGPGGRGYAFEHVRVSRYGNEADGYWLFEPARADKAKPLPVVLFVHGMNLPEPGVYQQWIAHLVKRGHLVVYPRYQVGSITDPTTFTESTAKAMRAALTRMDGKRHPKADTERFAMVGHSLGGTIALNLAARPRHYGLPAPKAIMPVLPGDVQADQGLGVFFPKVSGDYSTIDAGTLLLVIASTNDAIVGQRFAKRVYENTTQIKRADKDLLIISDDRHGRPALSADHFMPLAYFSRSGKREADAYDFALWSWFDALTNAAYGDGEHRARALGNTASQRWLGNWSDGRPVRLVEVYKPQSQRGEKR